MRILLCIILVLLAGCTLSSRTGLLNYKGKRHFEFLPEQSSDFIVISIGDKVIIDTRNSRDSTTNGLQK